VSRRTGIWMGCAAVVFLAVAAVAGVADWRLRDQAGNPHAHATVYAGKMSVGSGFARIDDYNAGDGPCDCDLLRWYVGPAGVDPSLVVTGPGLTLGPASGSGDKLWDWLVTGNGSAPESGRCYVEVDRLKQSAGLFDYPSIWHLTTEQVNDWNAGKIQVLPECEPVHRRLRRWWRRTRGGPLRPELCPKPGGSAVRCIDAERAAVRRRPSLRSMNPSIAGSSDSSGG